MQSASLGQAVILMLVVAIASSCAATKEYSSKLFTPRNPVAKEEKALSLRFLDMDSSDKEGENWVSTDYIMGRDTLNTTALDKLSLVLPPSASKTTDSSSQKQPGSTGVLVAKPAPVESEPVARYINQGEVRTKKTRE